MRTVLVAAALMILLIRPFAFSQMHYSRERSHSPTPTPTPTGTPQQKVGPTPIQIQARKSPAPVQRTMQPLPQSKAPQLTNQPKLTPTPPPVPAKPTPTPVPPPDVNAYLDRQIANSKDKKFHMIVNGQDLALTPFHVWAQKSTGPNSTSTSISMRSDDGRVYDIEFTTTGPQVSGIKIEKVNGEAVR
jgi:hypothetical protein